VSITFYECVSVAFGVKHAKRMCHIILSYVASLVLQFFSALSQMARFFEKVIEHRMCFDFLSNFCLRHFSF
jgi:ABC-type transport system involved in cytochrome bd biosynthesis fused ATPase/permease subunit